MDPRARTKGRDGILPEWLRHFIHAQVNCLPLQETWVQTLSQEDPVEEEMATHSSILAWELPWKKETGGLQSTGLQRVGHDWVDLHATDTKWYDVPSQPKWPWLNRSIHALPHTFQTWNFVIWWPPYMCIWTLCWVPWKRNSVHRTLDCKGSHYIQRCFSSHSYSLQTCLLRGGSSLRSEEGGKGRTGDTLRVRPRTDDGYKCLCESISFIFPFHSWMASTFLWTLPPPTPPPVNVLCNVGLSAARVQRTQWACCQSLPWEGGGTSEARAWENDWHHGNTLFLR